MLPLLIGLCLTPPPAILQLRFQTRVHSDSSLWPPLLKMVGWVQWRPKTRVMVDPQLEIVIIVTRESGPGPMLVFSAGESGPGGGGWGALGGWWTDLIKLSQ